MPDLILVDVFSQFGFTEFVEGDDDQGDEDVDEEEGKDDEVDDVEDRHLGPVALDRTLVLVRRRHRVLEHAGIRERAITPQVLC